MCSETWKDGAWVYKRQIKTLCDNEVWCLTRMSKHGYAPKVERVETDVIRTEYIQPEKVTNYSEFLWHLPIVLHLLEKEGIRHGDLDMYGVIPHGNKPYLVDFAESRLTCDPRPDKRGEGDAYWLKQTMEWMALGNLI